MAIDANATDRRNRHRRWTSTGVAVLTSVLLLAFSTAAFGHLALQSATPADGERLDRVPPVLELRFSEPIELPLFRIGLAGPLGEVLLGDPAEFDDRHAVRIAIPEPLHPGTYTVSWQAVGRDGHPVRGQYSFSIEHGAAGIAHHHEVSVITAARGALPSAPLPSFSSQSPLYAAVRWLTYLGIIGSAGAVGFALLIHRATRPEPPGRRGTFSAAALRASASLGILAVLLLVVSLPLRLQAQSHALFGAGITTDRFALLLGSGWGLGWLFQVTGCVLTLAGLLLARGGKRAGWPIASLGVLALVVSPGFSGHAAAAESYRVAAMVAHGGHVLGAAVWIGTLFALVVVALPLVRREAPARRGPLLTRLLTAFSPVALVAAAVVAATGLFAATAYLQEFSDLWSSAYGRLLVAKLFLVLLVLGAGAYNWQFSRPAAERTGSDRSLRLAASAELAAAVLVLTLTSMLVAVPPPTHGAGRIATDIHTDAAP
jgi:copper transport protein